MPDYLHSKGERREVPVTKNIPWFISASADTMHRHITEYGKSIESKVQVYAKLSTSATLFVSLATSGSFTDRFYIPPHYWKTAFILSAVYLGISGLYGLYNRNKTYKDITVENVVRKIAFEQWDVENSSNLNENKDDKRTPLFKKF